MASIYIAVLSTIGVISFFFAIGLFFFPRQLRDMNEAGNKILFTDERAIVYRKLASVLLFILGILFVLAGFFFKFKLKY